MQISPHSWRYRVRESSGTLIVPLEGIELSYEIVDWFRRMKETSS